MSRKSSPIYPKSSFRRCNVSVRKIPPPSMYALVGTCFKERTLVIFMNHKGISASEQRYRREKRGYEKECTGGGLERAISRKAARKEIASSVRPRHQVRHAGQDGARGRRRSGTDLTR